MSDYLVHFTDTAGNLGKILAQGSIRAGGPHGWGRNVTEVSDGHLSACFSEIPIDLLDRLRSRHGHYGVGFRRDFIRTAGGARVWYLDRNTPAGQHLFERIRQLLTAQDFDDKIWQLTPFIDPVIPGRYEWDWEREWRVPGGLRFELKDVVFIIAPDEDKHAVIENLSLDAPFLNPDDMEEFWNAVPQLGDFFDGLIARFLERFEDPIESLPWDDGYVWIVEQWSTEDAVDYLFDDLQDAVRERLCSHLNEISLEWVDTEEWKDFAE
jgi:Protein of unknown function (DUF2743).